MTALALAAPKPGSDLVPDGWADAVVVPWLERQFDSAVFPTTAAWLDGMTAAYGTLKADAFELVKARRLLEIRWGELLGPGQPGNPTGANQFGGTSHACDDPLSRDDRHRFRQLAAHKERALDYIRCATDADELSRAAVLRAAGGTSEPRTRRRTSQRERRTYCLAALLGDAKVRSPRPSRRRGRLHRDSAGEYDWYYRLTDAMRARVRREVFSPEGVDCDVLASRVGLSLDEWASRLVDALEPERFITDPLSEEWGRLAALDAERDAQYIETYEVTAPMDIGGVRVDWCGMVTMQVETFKGGDGVPSGGGDSRSVIPGDGQSVSAPSSSPVTARTSSRSG